MSRNFISEQTLIDNLLLNDTAAFEEIYRRYCLSLYSYSISKLNSPKDARRVVRDIFIGLWERRHSLPVDFSLSLYLYTEVRKSVVKIVNEKLTNEEENVHIEKMIIPGFAVIRLRQASLPVKYKKTEKPFAIGQVKKETYDQAVWEKIVPAFKVKSLRHAFQHLLNFW
jgi:hypothetical protein